MGHTERTVPYTVAVTALSKHGTVFTSYVAGWGSGFESPTQGMCVYSDCAVLFVGRRMAMG
jgi:hypothetical protein